MGLGYSCTKCGRVESAHRPKADESEKKVHLRLVTGSVAKPPTGKECHRYIPSPVEKAESNLLNARALEALRTQANLAK